MFCRLRETLINEYNLCHQIALSLERLIYSQPEEPYRIEGHALRYLPGMRPVRVRYIHLQDGVTRYDALQVQLLTTSLLEGDTAIDIGAHCGQYSILMAAMCGQTGRVVAFEPDPYVREKLLQNLNLNPRIKRPVVKTCAIADEAGEALLFSCDVNSLCSLVRSGVGFSSASKPEEIRVTLLTLDSYLLERGLPEPQWVKIDAEGAEIRILKGAKQVPSSDAGIVCELHPYACPEFGKTLSEFKDLAAASGRRIRYLDQEAEIRDRAEYGTVLLECQR